MAVSLLEGPGTAFDEWEQQICRTFVPLRARRRKPAFADFRGSVASTALGSVVLAEVNADEVVVERTARLIRQDDPELYKFGLQVSGTSVIEQDSRQANLRPGDLSIYDTSRPYWVSCSDDFRMTVAMFPRHLIRLPERQMAGLCAVRLAGDTELAALISPLMRGLAAGLTSGGAVIATHLGDAVVDLVTAAFAEKLSLPSRLDMPVSHRTLVAEVHAYIERHLHEPGLSTRTIARAHFVSARHLQKVFEEQGMSVSALIRSRRLERCRRDLVDPLLANVPLAVIGRRWGFPDAPHFSRLFRAAFGESPRDYRKGHMAALKGA
jgi:AraC-like DNA-binding protein